MSADKPWLDHYPPGVPAEIDPQTHASVVALFEACVAEFAERPAYVNLGATLTYAELDRLSRDFAAYLQGELGLAKGERVALMMPNLLQYPVALFGVLRAGLTVVNTNPLYTARELRHQLVDSGASAILILENFAHVLARVRAEVPVRHVITTRVGDLLPFPKSALVNFVIRHVKRAVPPFDLPGAVRFPQALAAGARAALAPVALGHDDLAFLQYTGGTTGLAKGAMLSHGNMVANVLQAGAWVSPYASPGRELIVTALPLYHIFALTANCLTFMRLGAANLLITNPRDMPAFVKALRGVPFTAITGVNTLFNALLNTPGFAELDFSHLRLVLGGGMAVQRAVAERWKAVTGHTIVEAFGLTETAPAACMNPLDLAEFNGSIGLPVPSTECSIRDDAGEPLPPGQPGELCVRGPQVMRGYWNRPEETRDVLLPGGWLRTGDIATMDERGFFFIVDRKKDMIIVSGFNVYPNEVEAVACEHPGVLEAAAVGVPDARAGEQVKLVVVRRDPDLTAEAIIAFCRERLTGYKVPKRVEFREDMPKTPVGKILRRALRDPA